ncbi:3-phosphoshikimate 1-carboxyvinyltransferase [Ornithinibacillus massiliensis]|uniref:3-phosphoshikimate 1-carboxyvinyltransferase n=1 Tax=Ornithinibacillus massiliensis TaxID=1944633 RepID=A0ABS5MJC5_9BACI|nr:3-phosphoshikimate 1-carboxyvinyltransferase [Ornithinibacillus massiliensis]MBS3681843.1 3-phosphoshikimate 1-carboxyvinyltransferase [Ornithinibacillus massiliensis]
MTRKKLSKLEHGLSGTIHIPGDKSISHRAIMFGALAKGKTSVTGFLPGEDCLNTISCFRQLGVDIVQNETQVEINGLGIEHLQEPKEVLDVGNSGTTIRLLSGILAGLGFYSCIQGDASIAKRPMKRIVDPLRLMGANIDGRQGGMYTPLTVRGQNLHGIQYELPVASAQVKSAILLAGLLADGTTTVIEPERTRDHTERMLHAFGVSINRSGNNVSIEGKQHLTATSIEVPGDISSAAFFLVAGAIVPQSQITLHHVGINPTRTGIIDVLLNMGATLTTLNQNEEAMEPYADIQVKASSLHGVEIGGEIIPRLIDEIPIIALAATQAEGTTVIKDAAELKVKETNRIDIVAQELSKMGAHIETTEDGMIIHGNTKLKGAIVNSHGDHRIGMMLAIAGTIAEGETILENSTAIDVSYPGFFGSLSELAGH